MEKTGELNTLENLERKIGTLGSCGCLMSLNMDTVFYTYIEKAPTRKDGEGNGGIQEVVC